MATHEKLQEADGHVPTGVEAAVAPFEAGCADLKQLYEHGKDEKNKAALEAMGGTAGVAAKLKTSIETGIPAADDHGARRHAFGANVMPEPPFESWWSLFIGCFSDEVLLILIAAAVVSIVIGSIPAVSDHPDTGWIDGFAILIAVFIVATVTATNDYKKQLQFRALSAESKSRMEVSVLRGGKLQSVGVSDVMVGDIVHLETGAKIPADGLVVRANDFKANESAITGESDDIRKDPVKTPILLSGTQVAAGTCDYLVTAVGTRSMAGSIMADASQEGEDTPLQVKLDLLARRIGYVGMLCALGTFVAMMIIKATGSVSEAWGPWTVKSFIYGVTIIVVAIPEGLPLAVTISLAYSTRKMLADQNLIRHLAACETMGSATDICSDKTGTLTENRMTTVALWIGGQRIDSLPAPPEGVATKSETWAALPAGLRALLRDQLALNSTANLMVSAAATAKFQAKSSKNVNGDGPAAPAVKREVKGSKTEGAGLLLVEALGYDIGAVRAGWTLFKQYPFSSERKMMTTIVKRPDGSLLQFTTGGSDFVLARCDKQLKAADAAALAEGVPCLTKLPAGTPLTAADKTDITDNVITFFATQSLRTLGVAVREWPSVDALPADYESNAPDADGLTLYAIQGIKDPLRRDVKDAVAACQGAGITVRMCTGDNRITATAIAKECGILKEGGLVMEGPVFRELTPAQLDEILPKLQVLSRSSPKDKNILVRRLNGNLPATREEWLEEHPGCDWETQRYTLLPGYKEEWAASRKHPDGNVFKAVVGVTGDGTNDAPALKAADVGLAMGIAGTDVAKDASDIIILDDRFSSIAKSVLWGRSVYDNVQKFLQFQLTVNVVALVLTFLSACLKQEPPLNPIMMLWVNLIMDTMGALALATEDPSPSLMTRKPYAATASLIIPRMWRFILAQSLLQLVLVMTLVVHGRKFLGITPTFLLQSGKWIRRGRKCEIMGVPIPFIPTRDELVAQMCGAGGLTVAACDALVDPIMKGLADSCPDEEKDVSYYMSTFIFNVFVWSQIFNEFNARHLGNDMLAAFRGMFSSKIFIVVIIISMGLQALFVELGGAFFKCTGLTGLHWGYTIGFATLTFPMGMLQRLVPVPARLSDFATTYVDWYAGKMLAQAKGGDAAVSVKA